MGCVGYDKSFPDELKAAAREVRKGSHLNLAAVQLKKRQWKEVVQNCDKVGARGGQSTEAQERACVFSSQFPECSWKREPALQRVPCGPLTAEGRDPWIFFGSRTCAQ